MYLDDSLLHLLLSTKISIPHTHTQPSCLPTEGLVMDIPEPCFG